MPSNRLLNSGSIIAIIAAVALGTGAWLYHKQSTEFKARSVELQQTREALDQTTQKAQEQEKSLNDAVKNSQLYQEEQKVRSIRAARLVKGLNAANEIKVAMAEHFMAYLKWPVSNTDAGVTSPDSYKKDGVASISVQPNGQIRLVFVNEAGNNEQVWLRGSVNAANQIFWKCSSPDITDIEQLIPSCVYAVKQ